MASVAAASRAVAEAKNDSDEFMRMLLAAAALLGLLATNAYARNFAVPDKDPAVTITVPDSWETEAITYGYSAQSPDKDVFFSVEFASARDVGRMIDNNAAWMKENNIKDVPPKKVETPFNGIPATIFQFETSDDNGPTTVELILLPAGKNRVIMLTLWGSDAERTRHGAAIDSIMSSVKAIQ
jgi:hypothetical protein